MDEKTAPLSAGYVSDRILRFSETIEKTREHFSELHPYGTYAAAAPYIERKTILDLLGEIGGDTEAGEGILRQYHAALHSLCRLEADLGDAYREKLRQELRIRTDAYAAAACHECLCSNGPGSSYRAREREIIALLMDELARDTDLDGLSHLIALLDEGWHDEDGTLWGTSDCAGESPAGNIGTGPMDYSPMGPAAGP